MGQPPSPRGLNLAVLGGAYDYGTIWTTTNDLGRAHENGATVVNRM